MYKIKIKPLKSKIKKTEKIKYAKLIGFDFIIDQNGIPKLLEANCIPTSLMNYTFLYDDLTLLKHIYSFLKGFESICINVDPKTEKHELTKEDAELLAGYIRKKGKNCYLVDDKKLNIDSKGMYIKDGTKKTRIDFLMDRQIFKRGFSRRLPTAKAEKLNIYPSPKLYNITVDKYLTTKVTKKFVPAPKTFLIKNKNQIPEANEAIHDNILLNNPKSIKPWIIVKLLKGTGSIGVEFIDDKFQQIELSKKIPFLIQERVTPWLNKGHVTDIRTNFVNGWASNAMVRVAKNSIHDKNVPKDDIFITSISHGGSKDILSPKQNNILKKYTLAAAYAIEDYLQEKWE